MSDYDLIIIGSGPAGYVGAIKAAQLGLKVACIEKEAALGGTCLNVGCIPSKALLHATELLFQIEHEGKEMGIEVGSLRVDFKKLMEYKQKIIEKLTGGIQFLLKKNKIDLIRGEGELASPTSVRCNGKEYRGKNILIATGSEAIPLPFLPFDEKQILSSTGALNLESLPKKMLIVGAGVIGLELGSVYRRLGAQVEVIEFLATPIPEFDKDLSKAFQRILEGQGFTFHFNAKVVAGRKEGGKVLLEVETKEGRKSMEGDVCLVSIGRRPFSKGLGLEKVGVTTDQRGFIKIDKNFRTEIPSIFAVGDVAGQPMLAHKGSEEAVAVVEMLAGHTPTFDYATIPNVVYTSPEVASVGFTEQALQEKGIPYNHALFPFVGNSRYQAMGGKEACMVKALSHKETGHLLGLHMIAPHASELIIQPALALHKKLTLSDLTTLTYPHPTLSEALHEVYLALLSKPIHI